jgi:hypothetical protein
MYCISYQWINKRCCFGNFEIISKSYVYMTRKSLITDGIISDCYISNSLSVKWVSKTIYDERNAVAVF